MTAGGDNEIPRTITAKSAYLALFCAVPIFAIFCLMGRWETGIGAWICSALVLLAVRTHWDLRKHLSFWIAVAIAALLQAPLVLLIPWENRNLTGITFLPVAALDYGLIVGCVKLAEMLIKKGNRERSTT